MTQAAVEIDKFKSLFKVETDGELATLISLGAQTISNWRNQNHIPANNKMLLTLLYRDLERNKHDYINEARVFYDECRAVALAAQKKTGVKPTYEGLIQCANERVLARKDKWLKDSGKEGMQLSSDTTRSIVAGLAKGAEAFSSTFLAVHAAGNWPPVKTFDTL